MALNAYLKITGSKQGIIKGSCIQRGKEGLIEVIAFDHEITSPRDAATGQASGKRQHQPLVVTKELDKSTTALIQALIQNETLSSFELKFFAPNKLGTAGGQGAEFNHFTIRLKNASVTGIKTIMPNNKNPELSKYAEYEECSFVYEEIEWVWTLGSLTTNDSLKSNP
ncbi:type VI secretion system tube protein TssD [Niabella yanshanensis]|uniref:Type VI secretion system tube protein TssD n=1 Tax=Niabella yanshanensis TaxID=577386 RepID=A0ABZ0WCM3_9BACT|nr:type VI secretion system tube protein TssD [Niabella yanshanensis]WQD40000.1 type VI secretion system tube protein TssD [Niabella yanshanensis]